MVLCAYQFNPNKEISTCTGKKKKKRKEKEMRENIMFNQVINNLM